MCQILVSINVIILNGKFFKKPYSDFKVLIDVIIEVLNFLGGKLCLWIELELLSLL